MKPKEQGKCRSMKDVRVAEKRYSKSNRLSRAESPSTVKAVGRARSNPSGEAMGQAGARLRLDSPG